MSEQPKQYPEPRRHVKVHLGVPELAFLIDLPDGVSIHSVIPLADPPGLDLVLQSDQFEPVLWEAVAPYGGSLRVDTVLHDGRAYRRYRVGMGDG